MRSNLPPGINENDLPGNRPEDQEIETIIIFTQGEIDALKRYNDIQMRLRISSRHELWDIISNIVEQLEEQEEPKSIKKIK